MLSIAVAACVLVTTPAMAAKKVVRDFRVVVDSEPSELHGQLAILIRTIAIRGKGVSRTKPLVRCDQKNCVRRQGTGPYRKTVRAKEIKFANVNWVIVGGQSITVAVHQRRKIGRFRTMGPKQNGSISLVLKKAGCLRKQFKRRKCPKLTKVPRSGTNIEQAPIPAREYFRFGSQVVTAWSSATGTDFRPVAGDVDGDGLCDIGLQRISTGRWYFRLGPDFTRTVNHDWSDGAGSDYKPLMGDFNGDGLDDLALRRESNGTWYVRFAKLPGPTFGSGAAFDWSKGQGTDLQPVVGDFNGDRIDDIGLRRISDGGWYFHLGPSFTRETVREWPGGTGTELQPLAGNFNGDAIDDLVFRRVTDGTWLFRESTAFLIEHLFAWPSGTGSRPVTGDFNGDGIDDIALQRFETGAYHIRTG